MTDLEAFTMGCFEAAEFFDDEEFGEETRLDLEADCRSFWRRFGCFITTEWCRDKRCTPSLAGHDFWLTRQGHGAGFWDGDWPEVYKDMLTKGAQGYEVF